MKIICGKIVIKGKSHFGMIMFFADCVNISSYPLTFSIKDLRCKFDYGKLGLDLLLAYKEVIVTSLTLHLTFLNAWRLNYDKLKIICGAEVKSLNTAQIKQFSSSFLRNKLNVSSF